MATFFALPEVAYEMNYFYSQKKYSDLLRGACEQGIDDTIYRELSWTA